VRYPPGYVGLSTFAPRPFGVAILPCLFDVATLFQSPHRLLNQQRRRSRPPATPARAETTAPTRSNSCGARLPPKRPHSQLALRPTRPAQRRPGRRAKAPLVKARVNYPVEAGRIRRACLAEVARAEGERGGGGGAEEGEGRRREGGEREGGGEAQLAMESKESLKNWQLSYNFTKQMVAVNQACGEAVRGSAL